MLSRKKRLRPLTFISRLFASLILLSLLASSTPDFAQAAPSTEEESLDSFSIDCQTFYTPKSGDTLHQVANQFGVDITFLAIANQLEVSSALNPHEPLCIPSKNPSIPYPVPPLLRAKIYYHRKLAIAGERFIPNRGYFVKTQAAGRTTWYRLGSVRANNRGVIRGNFTIPSAIRSAPRLRVCVKDMGNSRIFCTYARNY